jgi:hypothetical protein
VLLPRGPSAKQLYSGLGLILLRCGKGRGITAFNGTIRSFLESVGGL